MSVIFSVCHLLAFTLPLLFSLSAIPFWPYASSRSFAPTVVPISNVGPGSGFGGGARRLTNVKYIPTPTSIKSKRSFTTRTMTALSLMPLRLAAHLQILVEACSVRDMAAGKL